MLQEQEQQQIRVFKTFLQLTSKAEEEDEAKLKIVVKFAAKPEEICII